MSTFDNLKETVVNKIDELKSEFDNNSDNGVGLTEEDSKDADRTEPANPDFSSDQNRSLNDETISTTDNDPHVETVSEEHSSNVGDADSEIDPVDQFDEDYDISREDVRTEIENDQSGVTDDLYNTPIVNDERVVSETEEVDTDFTDEATPLYDETVNSYSGLVHENTDVDGSELYDEPVEDVEENTSSYSDTTRIGDEQEDPPVFEAP